MMDEHIQQHQQQQQRNECIKQRKLVRSSIDQQSPGSEPSPVTVDQSVTSTGPPSSSSSPIRPPPPAPPPSSFTASTTTDQEELRQVASSQQFANQAPPAAHHPAPALSLIFPQSISRSFDHTVAQSPPKYQIYHQFSRISSTTQQFIQRQQQQQQQQQQLAQQPRQQSPQTQPASPVTNYQAPLYRKASYGSAHYAHYAEAPSIPISSSSSSSTSGVCQQQPSTNNSTTSSLQSSKPMDQRSNNPFILNFNNISGCCLKNSPTPATSGSPVGVVPPPDTSSNTSATTLITSGAKRTRSLMLKSTSPSQHTLGSPPAVPPRHHHHHQHHQPVTSTKAGAPAPLHTLPATCTGGGSPISKHPSTSTGISAGSDTSDDALVTVSVATSTTALSLPDGGPAIVTSTCYVTPPTPAPIGTSEARQQQLPSLTFGTVTPAATGSASSTSLGDVAPVKEQALPGCGGGGGAAAATDSAKSSVRKKRDDFLKTTMKICLVVSPPSKLQMKSLSLTHLDDIERQATTPTIITNDPHLRKYDNSDTSNTSIASVSGGSSGYAVSPKDVCLTVTSGTALIDISNSGGGCINPAYDNGDIPGHGHRDGPTTTTAGDLVDGEPSLASTVLPPSAGTADSQESGPPSQAKSALTTSTVSSTLKKKSSSFLHRERKKPVLTRSQVSSSEYFSVCFESDNNDPGIPIPATKGVSLAESLRASLSRRSLSFSQIYVIDNGFSNPHETGARYTEPLDANMDISCLAGRTIIVSERDSNVPGRRSTGGHITLQKAASVGNQPSSAMMMSSTTSKLFTSTSTDDNYDQSPKASSASGKQSKQKWTIPFGSKGPQKSKLCELLDSYNKEIPKSTSSSSNFNNPEYVDALVGLRNLPQCWTEIVNSAGMSEAETKIQSAIWELVTTEVYYILALQTVTDLFLACLEDLQLQNILTDIDQKKLFSNIRDIWEANLRFWTLYLYPMVKHSERTREPMSIYYFQPGFINFATIFTPYTKYCAEQSTCQFYCKEMYHNNALFMTYCAWCESQKMCNRLRLADILVRPMQRLTKYGLLLAAIKKHITDEAEGETIDAMIHSVEEFVAGVNAHLTTRQESERLKGINARIDCYDVVESNNETLERLVKQHSIMFDLCQPMRGIDHGRKVFVEGDLKYKDSTGKMDVHCFLFTDFLLVCKKTKSDKLKIVRQPYMTDRLIVQLKDQALYCCYLNELNMVVAAFSLQSPKAQHWHDSITKVKHIYNRMKQGAFSDVRQYGNIINISNSCNNSTSNSNMNINNDNLSIKKSPLNSSIGSRVSSLNNSHSGSVDLNESKQVSIDFEKTNSLSSDEGAGAAVGIPNSGASAGGAAAMLMMNAKYVGVGPPGTSQRKPKNTVSTMQTKSSNSLTVQPYSGLGHSMPNLNLNSIQNSFVYSNTLSVPGSTNSQSHSGMVLLSPSQRGISYPPPSPTRATLRRGFAFSTSIKNPPLIKTRNVTSQQSFALTQQQSFNSATLNQHPPPPPCPLPAAASSSTIGPSPIANSCHPSGNAIAVGVAPVAAAASAGTELLHSSVSMVPPSGNISFFKRKNSFQSVPSNGSSDHTSERTTDRANLPSET